MPLALRRILLIFIVTMAFTLTTEAQKPPVEPSSPPPRPAEGGVELVLRDIGHAGTPEHPCPDVCTTVIRPAGDYRRCTWESAGPPDAPMTEYIPNTGDSKKCDAGVALDIEPRHRLFVHGIHSNREAWNQWYERVKPQMDYQSFKTVRDNTGWTSSFGDGSAPLLS